MLHTEVARALKYIDVIIAKLDAGDEKTFSEINRPIQEIKFKDIVEGIKSLRSVVIQTLFVKGKHSNFIKDSVSNWLEVVKGIHPNFVQVYSLDRPSWGECELVPQEELNKIVKKLRNFGVDAQSYGRRK